MYNKLVSILVYYEKFVYNTINLIYSLYLKVYISNFIKFACTSKVCVLISCSVQILKYLWSHPVDRFLPRRMVWASLASNYPQMEYNLSVCVTAFTVKSRTPYGDLNNHYKSSRIVWSESSSVKWEIFIGTELPSFVMALLQRWPTTMRSNCKHT